MTPRTAAELIEQAYSDGYAKGRAEAAALLRDALRGLVEAEDAVILVNAKWANDDHGSETERDFEAVEKQVDAAWDAARRALDEVEG